MHWWQMKIKITNRSNFSYRLVKNQWVHSRFDAEYNRETPHVEEDKNFSQFKPLLEPFMSPVFYYTTPHCVDDQAYINALKENSKFEGRGMKGGYPHMATEPIDSSEFDSAAEAAPRSYGNRRRRKSRGRSKESYRELTGTHKSPNKKSQSDHQEKSSPILDPFEKDPEIEQLLNEADSITLSKETQELVNMLMEEHRDEKSKQEEKMEQIKKLQPDHAAKSPTVYGLFQFRKAGSSTPLTIRTPMIYLNHHKF